MNESSSKSWVRTVILVGVVYFVVGFIFAALAKPSVSDQVRVWRLAAWVASAAMFAVHIGYENIRLGNSPLVTALHAAAAVAIGAFLLAIAATVHNVMVVSHAPYWRFLLALVVWPIVTALPAFLVAVTAAALLVRLQTKRIAA